MTNIYDSANELEREIRELPEFVTLKQAFEAVKADESADELFKNFQSLQAELQEKTSKGEAFSEEDGQRAQEMAGKVQANSLISDLMNKEQAFSLIMNDLNKIIMGPVRDLYQG